MPAQPCLTCRKPTTNGSRCPSCSTAYETARVARRGTRAQRGYGPAYRAARKQQVVAVPFCQHPGGCTLPITPANPLTADHLVPISRGGSADDGLRTLCLFHNSSRGNRG